MARGSQIGVSCAIHPPIAGLREAPIPCRVITAPWPTLTLPVPFKMRATRPGTATLCKPAHTPSMIWTGYTPHGIKRFAAIRPPMGSAINEILAAECHQGPHNLRPQRRR